MQLLLAQEEAQGKPFVINLMGTPEDVLAWPYFHAFLPGVLKYGAVSKRSVLDVCACLNVVYVWCCMLSCNVSVSGWRRRRTV